MSDVTRIPLQHILTITVITVFSATLGGLILGHWIPVAAVIVNSYIFWVIVRFSRAKRVEHLNTIGALLRGLMWFTGM